jgi:tetratricopeptide (TPR) repeat protein
MSDFAARLAEANDLINHERDYDGAATIYADILLALPSNSLSRAEVLYNLGSCFEVQQRFGNAIEAWHEALTILESQRHRNVAFVFRVKASLASHERFPRAFVSYAHLDRDLVGQIVEQLDHSGVYTIIDNRDLAAGKTVSASIDDVMEQCANVIIFWSAAYNGRTYTMDELNAAVAATRKNVGRRAVIAQLDDEPLPEPVSDMLFIPRQQSIEELVEKIRLALTARRS